jgi:nickel/cobalt exporter
MISGRPTLPRAFCRPDVCALALGVLALAIVVPIHPALAQGAGPFGVGAPETGSSLAGTGIFSGLFIWIAGHESAFYRDLVSAMQAFRHDPHAALLLTTLSLAYGIFHAAGPGHGKAVIASYIIANKQTLRRGIILSFISAFIQGAVAIAFVAAARYIFNVTAVEMTEATEGLELTSALMITSLGLWLVATKVLRVKLSRRGETAEFTDIADAADPTHVHSDNCTHALFGSLQPGAQKAAGGMLVCADCGSTHMPDPKSIEGPFSWRKAVGAVAAVGIRPCSGAIIVLVFAFSERMYVAGILSVAAMSLGTGITVALLAGGAVYMKERAVRFAGADSWMGGIVVRSAEVIAAFGVLMFGSLLLGATLMGAPTGG